MIKLINEYDESFPIEYTLDECTSDYEKGWNECLRLIHHQKPVGNELVRDAAHILFLIGEILVDESKGHYTSEVAIDKIRKVLSDNQDAEKKLMNASLEIKTLDKIKELFKGDG